MSTSDSAKLADELEGCRQPELQPSEVDLIVKALRAYAQRADVPRQEWISVKDRMPAPYHAVLIGWDRIAVRIKPICAFWTGEKWTRDTGTDDNFFVSHWMELPDQPSPSNSEERT